MDQSIAARIKKVLALFAGLLLLQSAILFYETSSVAKQSEKIHDMEVPLLLTAKDLKMSVVQVQQWLTDISATRGLDGLDDGFDVAKEYADIFKQQIATMVELDPKHAEEYKSLIPTFDSYYQVGSFMARAYVDDGPAGGNSMMEDFDAAANAINEKVDHMLERIVNQTEEDLLKEVEGAYLSQITVVITFIIFIICMLFALRASHRSLITPLNSLRDTVKGLATNNENNIQPVSINDSQKDEIYEIYDALNQLITKLQKKAEEESKLAEENGRIKKALDECNANVMVADADLDIIYHNDALRQMMEQAKADIQKELPNFDPSTLIGSNIDIFHESPKHQRKLLKNLNAPHKAQISIGGRILKLMITPVLENGSRIGYVVEWNDVTQERNIEDQIQHLVSAAAKGDLTNRINLSDDSGFFARLTSELNALMEVTETALGDVVNMMSRMSQGDMRERITADYEGIFGQLCDDANNMADKLTSVVHNLTSSSENVSLSSAELASANNSLQSRTESQAVSLETTAASMEEITSTVQKTAENAQDVANLIEDASRTAEAGEESVSKVVEAMDSIQESSNKIDQIIVVIDEIAFQTNLLALNAAVEAARAGESGKGFAVVASEVRNLAQRSATAAGDIKSLIGDSVQRVNVGVERVQHSGEVIENLISSMKSVKEIVDTVTVATKEQTAGILSINGTVSELDSATQQNTALVEELAATATDLASQAGAVKSSLSFFKV
ncbi:MAG: methyl-accepting chemotaxis protein [Neptuniibacter sp.]